MTQRIDYMQRSLELFESFTNRIRERVIEAPIRDPVPIRASQTNRGDFDVDPHFEHARIQRERELGVIVAATALALGALIGAPAIAAPMATKVTVADRASACLGELPLAAQGR
jgi:hypothetical protein